MPLSVGSNVGAGVVGTADGLDVVEAIGEAEGKAIGKAGWASNTTTSNSRQQSIYIMLVIVLSLEQ